LAQDLSVTFVPVIVNHQLQAHSADVANKAAQQCEALGLSRYIITAVDVVETGEGLEAAARKSRYEAFHNAIAETGAVAILLAHSLEDQAETVLMRLSRGSGTRSISAMAEEQGTIWRPLLSTTRTILRQALAEQDITAHDDPHNFDDKFLRVKVRNTLLPTMREILGDNVDEALARTAALARDDADALDYFAEMELQSRIINGELDISNFAKLPKAVSTRCVRMWLLLRGVNQLNFEHIDAVWRLATDTRVQGPVKVVGGVEVSKASGRLRA
jgi:tRNA(Ile)-lysidine synthetase-like protein